jgi:Ca-activated chloride channel family protein
MHPATLFGLVDPRFASPEWVHALWLAPLVALLLGGSLWLRRRGADRFADDARRPSIVGRKRVLTLTLRVVCATLAVTLGAISLARPQANPQSRETESRGRDIVFVLDVSRSMLARDVAPNRLERAKLWIRDLVSELRQDRVALVAFAGSSSVESPLTTDRLFFDLALDELAPSSVDVGGTNIGDAIRRCMDLVFYDLDDESVGTHRDIILITDGEDQESLPIEAASAAGAKGIRIIALGIGSESGDVVRNEQNQPVTRAGQPVRTRLDSGTLARIANATPGGVYLNVGTGDIDLAGVYQDLIASADQSDLGKATITTYDELYLYALAPALALALLEFALGSLGLRKDPRP